MNEFGIVMVFEILGNEEMNTDHQCSWLSGTSPFLGRGLCFQPHLTVFSFLFDIIAGYREGEEA